jgi:hypothetical protein
MMASEMKDPRRTIPFSILGAITIAAVVFYAVATVVLGVFRAAEMAKDDVPLKAGGADYRSVGWLANLCTASTISGLVSALLSASRSPHELPKWLREVDPRYHVPWLRVARNCDKRIAFDVPVPLVVRTHGRLRAAVFYSARAPDTWRDNARAGVRRPICRATPIEKPVLATE